MQEDVPRSEPIAIVGMGKFLVLVTVLEAFEVFLLTLIPI